MNDSSLLHEDPARSGAASPGQGAVSRDVIEAILDLARRAPSGVNTQPWNVYVLRDDSRNRLVEQARSGLPRLLRDADAQARFWDRYKCQPGSNSWPGPDWENTGTGFIACADAAFGGGQLASQADLAQYFNFFGAPVALMCTIDRALGLGSVLDYGMFLQNIAMAAAARGLRTAVQTGWRGLSDEVLPFLHAPEGALLLAGVALACPTPGGPGPDAAPPAPRASDFTLWHV